MINIKFGNKYTFKLSYSQNDLLILADDSRKIQHYWRDVGYFARWN